MKAIKNTLVALKMFVSLLGYAVEDVNFGPIESKKVKITFEDAKQGEILTVRNRKGEIFHKEEILHDGKLYRVFDFSHLADGTYEIDLDKGSEMIIKPFIIKAHKLTFKKDFIKHIHQPIVYMKDNYLKISKINFEHTDVEVIIYYNDSEIYSGKLNAQKECLSEMFKLNEYERGDYRVIVHSDEHSYIHDFKY